MTPFVGATGAGCRWPPAHVADRTAIVFAPHPDDEVIACGGTIQRKIAEGFRVFILFSTDGSRSHEAVLDIFCEPSAEELVEIRRREAIAAAAVLGVAPEFLIFAGLTDTCLAQFQGAYRDIVGRTLARIGDIAEVYIPHAGLELNADHRLTGSIVAEELANLGLAPRIFRYVVWDAQTEEEFGYRNRMPDEATPRAPDEDRIRIDISGQLNRKLVALMEHRTQVTLFSPHQRRTVVPDGLMARIRARRYEEFWVERSAGGGAAG
jgi:LmbE family N-acetylglucosaminyl deacetylase